jgi:hypothetical protein
MAIYYRHHAMFRDLAEECEHLEADDILCAFEELSIDNVLSYLEVMAGSTPFPLNIIAADLRLADPDMSAAEAMEYARKLGRLDTLNPHCLIAERLQRKISSSLSPNTPESLPEIKCLYAFNMVTAPLAWNNNKINPEVGAAFIHAAMRAWDNDQTDSLRTAILLAIGALHLPRARTNDFVEMAVDDDTEPAKLVEISKNFFSDLLVSDSRFANMSLYQEEMKKRSPGWKEAETMLERLHDETAAFENQSEILNTRSNSSAIHLKKNTRTGSTPSGPRNASRIPAFLTFQEFIPIMSSWKTKQKTPPKAFPLMTGTSTSTFSKPPTACGRALHTCGTPFRSTRSSRKSNTSCCSTTAATSLNRCWRRRRACSTPPFTARSAIPAAAARFPSTAASGWH